VAHLVRFFIIYVSSQQLQGQLQTQHSVDNDGGDNDDDDDDDDDNNNNNNNNYSEDICIMHRTNLTHRCTCKCFCKALVREDFNEFTRSRLCASPLPGHRRPLSAREFCR
jgi:hypothetical protein